MGMKTKELKTELKNFTQIWDHIEELLTVRNIQERTRIETLMIFEALYNDMLAKGIPEDTVVKVWKIRVFGEVRIKIDFEGSLYVPISAEGDDFGAGSGTGTADMVISAYGERIENRYHGGRNHPILTARRSFLRQARFNVLALVMALLAYIPIVALAGKTGQEATIHQFVYQIENLFTDAVLMVGGPVTFFALLRNLTNMFISAEGNAFMRKLEFRAIITSAVAVLLAFVTCFFIQYPFAIMYNFISVSGPGEATPDLDASLSTTINELIDSIVDPSIFETFGSFAPFPLIILAILTTYALCSAGSYYASINRVIEGCYVLFSKMLAAVMYTMPFFAFLAMLDAMLNTGYHGPGFLICLTVFVPLSMIIMMGFYSVRLAAAGISPGPFAKRLIPLLKENLEINSTIDAVPFNIRYCVTKFGLDRNRLIQSMPALARLNLDGNCFVITTIAVMFMIMNGRAVSIFDVVVVGIVILFLSLGAPNQPGSTLIGLLVIISYLQTPEVISMAIFSEALFGGILSMTNAAGDIVTVTIEDRKEKKRREQGSGPGPGLHRV